MGDRSESLGLPHRTASKPQLPSHPLPGNSVSPSHVKMVGLIPPSRAEMVGPHESGRARPLVNWLPRRAICCALSHRRSSVVSRASPGIITTDTVATATDAARPQLLPPPPPPLPLHLLRTPARHPTPTPVYGSGGKSNDACAPSSRERMGRKSTAVARGFRPPNTQSGHVHSGGAAEDRKATPYPPTIAPPFSAMDEGHAALQRGNCVPPRARRAPTAASAPRLVSRALLEPLPPVCAAVEGGRAGLPRTGRRYTTRPAPSAPMALPTWRDGSTGCSGALRRSAAGHGPPPPGRRRVVPGGPVGATAGGVQCRTGGGDLSGRGRTRRYSEMDIPSNRKGDSGGGGRELAPPWLPHRLPRLTAATHVAAPWRKCNGPVAGTGGG